MHDTALKIGQLFLECYCGNEKKVIVDFGSLDVNGSLRSFANNNSVYIGVDVVHGKSVDLVVEIGQPLPIRGEFADIVISTSQMEHDSFFWLSFLELIRVLKPGGYLYLNAPSNGCYHRYPEDNWRFYPDAGRQLAKWANKNNFNVVLIESFIAKRKEDQWNDFVAVFTRDNASPIKPSFLHEMVDCFNIWKYGQAGLMMPVESSEDQLLLNQARELQQATALELAFKNEQLTNSIHEIQALNFRIASLEQIITDFHQSIVNKEVIGSESAESNLETLSRTSA